MIFQNPDFLWFLVVIPVLVFSHFVSLKFVRQKALKFANFPAIEYVTGRRILSKNYLLLVMRIVTLLLVILSASGMVVWYEGKGTNFDFVLAIDASGSMLAQDYQPNRLEAAKESALLFVDNLPQNTSVGVVSFAGVSFIKQRLTSDFSKVKKAVTNISIELVGGTAIGSAIITSVNLLANPERNKVVILLTDGQNNVGPAVEDAVNYAVENHVTINTIGIGTEEGGAFPEMNLSFVSKLDTKTLEIIANKTGGMFYRAENRTELEKAYKDIATAIKQKLPIYLSMPCLLMAMVLLIVEWVLVNTKYRTLP
ncbi:MAG: VWA domain-containing protein [Candidatus Aenigmarchaeota archaeon]|nr:VWA domain-containing protein [Candidatus Aenigmarchaeota archaeon]